MKADIINGQLVISPTTPTEIYAMEHWIEDAVGKLSSVKEVVTLDVDMYSMDIVDD